MYGVVYLIIDGTNDLEYVGQTTKTAEERFKAHTISKHYIGKAIRAHGVENFTTAILKECASKDELDRWEKHFIKSRGTKVPYGYNFTDGGEGVRGVHHSPKTCSKISATQRKDTPFKNLIREIDRCQLSYAALAKLMNLSFKSVSVKTRGKQNFTETEWKKLAEILGKPVEYLMVRDDEKISVSKRHSSPFKNLIAEIDGRKLTYAELAKLMNLPPTSVSGKTRGLYNFSETEWAKLAEIFDKPAEYLMVRCDGLPAITNRSKKRKPFTKEHRANISAARRGKPLSLEHRIKIGKASKGKKPNLGKHHTNETKAHLSVSQRKDSVFKNLSNEITLHRFSYSSLAKLIDLSESSVSLKMLGKIRFTAKDIDKLVKIFNKPAEYLMARE